VLADLSPSTEYVVGVKVGDDAAGSALVVGEVTFDQPKSTAVRIVSKMVDWPRERIKVAPGIVELSSLSQARGSLVIYLTVAPGTDVQVDTADKTLARVSPENGLLVHNGIYVAQEVKGLHTLMSRLIRPNPPTNTPPIIEVRKDEFVVTPRGLAANMRKLRKPTYPVGVTVDGVEQVSLRIMINEEGRVTGVDRVRGTAEFLDAAEQAVSAWKFRPFSVDGRAVAVKASVVFFFGADGTIKSPIFDEMANN
jgi:TonB-like protein